MPELGRARLAARDDPFDAQTWPDHEGLDAFGNRGIGKWRKEVHAPAAARVKYSDTDGE